MSTTGSPPERGERLARLEDLRVRVGDRPRIGVDLEGPEDFDRHSLAPRLRLAHLRPDIPLQVRQDNGRPVGDVAPASVMRWRSCGGRATDVESNSRSHTLIAALWA